MPNLEEGSDPAGGLSASLRGGQSVPLTPLAELGVTTSTSESWATTLRV
jgi:hypothetical protein